MNLRGIDLNLLPVLDAVLREGSVSGAARRLGMSQPATSHALTRLRHLLDDPLLVRFGRGMRLTDRARELATLCETACGAIEAVVVNEAFDPAAASLTFSIATPDYLALILGQDLLPILRRQAPGIAVRFVDVGSSLRDLLMAGEVDMAAIAFIPAVVDGLSVTRDFIDPLVCVVARGHPLARHAMVNWAEMARHNRLEIDATPDLLIPAPAAGRTEPVSIAASHMMVLPFLAACAQAYAIVPRSLAMRCTQGPSVDLIDIDGGGNNMEYCLAWHSGHDRDRGHLWLRGVLSDILRRHFPSAKPFGGMEVYR